jgi:hypothetical protein
MTRHLLDLDAASVATIPWRGQFATKVTRYAALSEGRAKNAGFWIRVTRQVATMLPAKSNPTKRLAASKVADVARVTRPLMRLVGCQFRYTVFECHNDNKRPRQAVGAKSDPLYGWLVNATGSANRLIRFTT